MSAPEFPAAIRINGRLFVDSHEHENYKRGLLGLEPLSRGESVKLIPIASAAAEVGIGRRTAGRRVRGRVVEIEGNRAISDAGNAA